jgi:hypothetical protein
MLRTEAFETARAMPSPKSSEKRARSVLIDTQSGLD